MTHRWLAVSGVLAAFFVCDAASAQEMTPQSPAPPPATDPSTDPAPTVASTTMVTSAEPLPPRPSAEEREPSPSARKSCGLINHACSGPHVALALEGGASSFNESSPFAFNTGIGSVSTTGPSWGVRVGLELTSWLAFDAHYAGMNNHASGAGAPDGSVSLLTSGVTGEVRLTAPLPYVQPYLLTGAGVYSTSVTGSASAQGRSPLLGSTELGVPVGLGLSIPIAHGISAGAELTYHRFFGESFASDEEIGGGDLTTMNAVVRARL